MKMHQRLTSLKELSVLQPTDAEGLTLWDHEPELKEADPLWERELELEELMQTTGMENVSTAADKAKKRGNVSHLAHFRKLTELMLAPITAELEQWLFEQKFAPRAKAIAYPMLKELPASTSSLIALRTLLDRVGSISSTEGVGSAPVRLLALALSIGHAVEAEARMVAWAKKKPNIWHAVQRQLSDDKATAIHRRRANVNRFNAKVRDEIGWVDWTHDQLRHVGLRLVDMLVIGSKSRIIVQADPEWQRKSKNDSPSYIVSIDHDTQAWLLKALGTDQLHSPVLMPTVMKPAPWSDMWDGGYLTGTLPQRSLIRFKADNAEQAKVAVRELGKVDMPRVYDAINTIQEVPWTINQRVLDVARQIWDADLGTAGFPQKEAEPLPFKSPEADIPKSAANREWRMAAAKVHARNALKVSKVKRVERVMFVAETYKDDERFYFPHVLDFRGRMYPLPVDLQPQGEDLARGLLTFAEGKPLGDSGVFWLAVHLANCWGQDKINGGSFKERVKWVVKNEKMFRSIAADPINNRRWAIAKGKHKGLTNDHWQALAATFEWVAYLDHGDNTFVSALPVRVDGTCNGIQHLSAMVRDEVGGASVNLIPGNEPRDIYTEVGAMVERKLLVMTEGYAWARKWLEAVNGKLPREVTKRPVMILPYGGTKRAYLKYTLEWMDEYDPAETIFPDDERYELAAFLVDILWEEVELKLPRARAVQKWLQDCARLAASTNLPLRWTTPIGFVVRHFYGTPVGTKIETLIDGQRVTMRDWTISKNMSVQDQMRGIPPNFTHSMDGSVLMSSVNKAYNAGIDSITTIHDAYGTVAADVDLLNACLREAFIWTYKEHNVLADFKSECAAILDDDIDTIMALPSVPAFGTLDLDQIREADYFFA